MITICVLFFLTTLWVVLWKIERKLEQKRFDKWVDEVIEALKKESEMYQQIIKERNKNDND